ncbi:hypothetical protein C2E23DRAFT_844154, partial [Lenzites betulinus]
MAPPRSARAPSRTDASVYGRWLLKSQPPLPGTAAVLAPMHVSPSFFFYYVRII